MKKGKKIWNRLLSLVLCLVMVMGVFAGMGMEAYAAETLPTVKFKDIEYVTYGQSDVLLIESITEGSRDTSSIKVHGPSDGNVFVNNGNWQDAATYKKTSLVGPSFSVRVEALFETDMEVEEKDGWEGYSDSYGKRYTTSRTYKVKNYPYALPAIWKVWKDPNATYKGKDQIVNVPLTWRPDDAVADGDYAKFSAIITKPDGTNVSCDSSGNVQIRDAGIYVVTYSFVPDNSDYDLNSEWWSLDEGGSESNGWTKSGNTWTTTKKFTVKKAKPQIEIEYDFSKLILGTTAEARSMVKNVSVKGIGDEAAQEIPISSTEHVWVRKWSNTGDYGGSEHKIETGHTYAVRSRIKLGTNSITDNYQLWSDSHYEHYEVDSAYQTPVKNQCTANATSVIVDYSNSIPDFSRNVEVKDAFGNILQPGELTYSVKYKKDGTDTIVNQIKDAGTYTYVIDMNDNIYTLESQPSETITVNKIYGSISIAGVGPLKYDVGAFDLPVVVTGESPVKYTSNNPNVLTVDEKGHVTINGVGTETITVTMDESTNYYETSSSVEVTIKKADPSITIENLSKVYDKEDTGVTCETTNTDPNSDNGITVEYKKSGDPETAYSTEIPVEVGTYDVKVSINATKNFNAASKTGTFTITPKELTISILKNGLEGKATEILSYEQLDGGKRYQIADFENLRICINGIVDEADKETISALDIIPISDLKDIKLHENAIKVSLDNIDNNIENNSLGNKNYYFSTDGESHQWADLEIVKENISDTSIDDLVTFSGENIYLEKKEQSETLPWVQKDAGLLNVTMKDKYSTRYGTVVTGENSSWKDLTVSGITGRELEGNDALNIYFTDGKGNFSTEKVLNYKVDGDAPVAKYQTSLVETKTVLQNVLGKLSFGTFDKSVYNAKFIVSDGEGSGIKDVKAYVWKLTKEDLENGVVSEQKILDKMSAISDDEWKAVSGDNGEYSTVVAQDDSGKAELIQASYIVFTKVTDNVNNTKIYASNGVVIEDYQPVITTSLEENKLYNSDVQYSIKVAETESDRLDISGIAKVTWDVFCNDKKVEALSDGANLNKTNGEQYTSEELKNVFAKDLSLSDLNSNNIRVKIAAEDRSGNVIEKDIPVMIDKTKPIIEVSFDNNNALNGSYFNADRVATITFTERNFDKTKALFNLKLGTGEIFTGITLEEINANVPGVTAEWFSDSQEGIEVQKLTDERTIKAKITFSGENIYSDFSVNCTDLAGNVNEGVIYANDTVAENVFTIDKSNPEISGAKEGEVYYTTQTITVKDTNLATITLDGETVTSPVSLPGNVDKVYKLVAIDKEGNKAVLSISMKPLSDLSGDITDNNVTLADEKELEKSEELLKNELEKGNLSDEEKKDVKDRLTEIQNLLQEIDEVKDVIKMLDNLPDAYLEDGETVNPYVSDRMDDEEQKLYSAVKAAYKAYNKLSAHQQRLISTGLKHNLSNLRKVLTDYRITDGDGKVWVYDTNGTITFTANGPVCRFENALVDGKKVPAEEMKVTKGSTVVELDAGYLYRLGLGDHTFQMEYTDGETDVVEFSIVTMEVWNTMMKQSGTNQTGIGAATGDSANILLWGAALAVGAIGMVVAKKRRKDEEA